MAITSKLSSIIEIKEAAAEAVRVISNAALEATTKLSHASESAAKVVTEAAAAQVRVVDAKNAGDHDLLVVLNSKMEDIKEAVKELASRDGLYVLKEDFIFWRNLLVGSMIGTIFLGIVVNIIFHANTVTVVHP